MRKILDGTRSLGCSKATVAKCAAKMEEERIGAERLESMTDAEVCLITSDLRI